MTTRSVAAGEELFASYGPSYWVGGQPVDDAALDATPRRLRSCDVLDSSYWGERGGARTIELLEAASEAVRATEARLREQHASVLDALDAGLEDAIETVAELLQPDEPTGAPR